MALINFTKRKLVCKYNRRLKQATKDKRNFAFSGSPHKEAVAQIRIDLYKEVIQDIESL